MTLTVVMSEVISNSYINQLLSTAVLRIRSHLIRIRIQHLNTDRDPDTIRIPGFYDQKLKKCSATTYLFLGLHKGRLGYKRSLQLSKENIQHLKT
jgi:hypothetical protein